MLRPGACTGRASATHILYEVKPPTPADVLAASGRRQGCGRDARRLRAAGAELYRAQGQARRFARRQNVEPGKAPIPNGPAPKVGAQDDRVPQLRERLGPERRRHDLRQGARRRGEEVPAGARAQGQRPAHAADHRRAQWPLARPADRHSSSPTSSAGAGCRTTSARTM